MCETPLNFIGKQISFPELPCSVGADSISDHGYPITGEYVLDASAYQNWWQPKARLQLSHAITFDFNINYKLSYMNYRISYFIKNMYYISYKVYRMVYNI